MNSSGDPQVVQCPACSKETFCRIVSTITQGTRELKALFTGELNKANCMSCSIEFLVEIPLIYRDNIRRFLVYYSPQTSDDSLPNVVDIMEELYRQLFQGLPQKDKPDCRLTLARRDFIEKIAIHQHGYDDRLIEYIKYQLFQHSKKGLDPNRMDLLFDFSNSDDEQLSFISFDRKTGKPVYSLNFLLTDYYHLEDYFLKKSEMEVRLNQLFRKYHVHVSSLL